MKFSIVHDAWDERFAGAFVSADARERAFQIVCKLRAPPGWPYLTAVARGLLACVDANPWLLSLKLEGLHLDQAQEAFRFLGARNDPDPAVWRMRSGSNSKLGPSAAGEYRGLLLLGQGVAQEVGALRLGAALLLSALLRGSALDERALSRQDTDALIVLLSAEPATVAYGLSGPSSRDKGVLAEAEVRVRLGESPLEHVLEAWQALVDKRVDELPAYIRGALQRAAQLLHAFCRVAVSPATPDRERNAPPSTGMAVSVRADQPPLPATLPSVTAPVQPQRRRRCGRLKRVLGARSVGGLTVLAPSKPRGLRPARGESSEDIAERAAPSALVLMPDPPIEIRFGSLPNRLQTKLVHNAYQVMRERLLCPDRYGAYTLEECHILVGSLVETTRKAIQAKDVLGIGLGMVVLLSIATYRSVRALSGMELMPANAEGAKGACWISPDGYLCQRVPVPEQHFEPLEAQRPHLVPVVRRSIVALPAICQEALEAWLNERGRERVTLLGGAQDVVQAVGAFLGEHSRRAQLRPATQGLIRAVLPGQIVAMSSDTLLAQVLTGVTTGLPTVGMAYRTLPLAELQRVYDRTLTAMGFEVSRKSPDPALGAHIGSALRLHQQVREGFAKYVRRGLNHAGHRKHVTLQETCHFHARMAAYCGWFLMQAVAARSERILVGLVRQEMCLESGQMFLDDKRVDIAHTGRWVVLSPSTVAQIQAYLCHLQALVQDTVLPPLARDRARDALNGRGPLFFLLGTVGQVVPISREALRPYAPASWPWPANVFRHQAATHLHEQGCPALYVSIQLGHLDLGQPFGRDGDVDPRDVVAQVGAATDRAMARDGWRVVRGMGDPKVAYVPHAVPLDERVISIEAKARARERGRWGLQETYGSGEKLAIDHASRETARQLVDAWRVSMPGDGSVPQVDARTVSELRQQMLQSRPRTQADQAIALNALREELHRAHRQRQLECKDLRRAFYVGVEPSPYASGMIGAVTTVRAMRLAWQDLICAQLDGPPEAHTLYLALLVGAVLFGLALHEDAVTGLILGLARMVIPGGDLDVVIVPLAAPESQPDQSIALPGILAFLAVHVKSYVTTVPVLGVADLDRWLRKAFGAFLPTSGSLLSALMAAVRLTARFELPGALRAVLDRALPTTTLAPERLAALLEDRQAGRRPSPIAPSAPPPHQSPVATRERVPPKAASLRKLLGVLRNQLNPHGEPIRLERGGGAKGRGARLRNDALLADIAQEADEVHDVLALAARYALKLRTEGSEYTPCLAPSTIYSYALRIVPALLRFAPPSGLLNLDEEEFIALYELCSACAPDDAVSKIRSLLAYFHVYLVSHHRAVELDPADILQGARSFARVDANMVMPREYVTMHDDVTAQITHGSTSGLRILRAARIVLILMRYAKMRIGEATTRRLDDVRFVSREVLVLVRPNRDTQLKTAAAKRLIRLQPALSEDEFGELKEWCGAEVAARGGKSTPDALLFPVEPGGSVAMDPATLARPISELAQCATGLANARPHWLRHAGATVEFLAIAGRPWIDTEASTTSVAAPLGRLAQLKRLIGHVDLLTTFGSYIHAVQLCLGQDAFAFAAVLAPKRLAQLVGISHENLRTIRGRLGAKGRINRVFFARLVQRHQPVQKNEPEPRRPWVPGRDTPIESVLGASMVIRILGDLRGDPSWKRCWESLELRPGQRRVLARAIVMQHLLAEEGWIDRAILAGICEFEQLDDLRDELRCRAPMNTLPAQGHAQQQHSAAVVQALMGVPRAVRDCMVAAYAYHRRRPYLRLSTAAHLDQFLVVFDALSVERQRLAICVADEEARADMAVLLQRSRGHGAQEILLRLGYPGDRRAHHRERALLALDPSPQGDADLVPSLGALFHALIGSGILSRFRELASHSSG